MRRPLLLLLPLLACAPAAPRLEPAPPPQFAATGVAQRVVLMTFDGLGADELARQSGLPAFEHLARTAAVARVVPVNPTLTAPTHVSILTGADPQLHGIVSNHFHLPGTPPEESVRGIDVESDVETLVEAARRQGKRVGAVPFPTLDGSTPRRSADFGLVWTHPLVPGRVVRLTRADFRREWVPPTWTTRPQRRTSFSPTMRARLEWSASRTVRTDVDIVAYDTTNDGMENYDTYTVENGDGELPPDPRGWFAVAREHHGSWSKILSATRSLDVTLYWGPISRTRAYPDEYRDLLDRELGFWPGLPDENSEIDPALFADQVERLADFMSRAQTLSIERMPFDLLLAYQAATDQAGHDSLGRDDTVMRRAWMAADRALGAIGARLDASRDALVVTGDHGLVPVERVVRIDQMLEEHGFAPRWRAYTSNSVVNLYRFSGEDDSDAVVNMLTSSGAFERVEKKTASSHRNSGEIVATTLPNVSLSEAAEMPAGQHGALNAHRELHTILFASGFGTRRGDVGTVSQTKIARFVSGLLGIAPPAAAE